MRVFILTLGSRGDFELFRLLGRELIRRGHEVVMGTSGFLEARTRECGAEWEQIGGSSQQEVVDVLRALAPLRDKNQRTLQFFKRWLLPEFKGAWGRIASLAAGSDYFINNLKLVLKREGEVIPGASVTYDPPNAIEDLEKYGGPDSGDSILDLVALNKRLVDPNGQWGDRFRFTGFWSDEAPSSWSPPSELVSFLESGSPPVIVAMGSSGSAMFDLSELVQVASQALEDCGERGVVVGGWSGNADAGITGGNMLCISEAPYEWLFPHAACVVHHGGVGTLATALRAGKPSIVLPQLGCQEEFGRILVRERLATAMFDTFDLSRESLAEAIRAAVSEAQFAESARSWKTEIESDPGVTEAANLIEAHWESLRG